MEPTLKCCLSCEMNCMQLILLHSCEKKRIDRNDQANLEHEHKSVNQIINQNKVCEDKTNRALTWVLVTVLTEKIYNLVALLWKSHHKQVSIGKGES